jgi:hypothetical protein
MRISSQILRAITKTLVMVQFLITMSIALPGPVQGQARSQVKPMMKPDKQKGELAAFLSAPINLVYFKRIKGISNSGSAKVGQWIYRPKKPGFFYQYILFSTPKRYPEGTRFSGFSVVVYKFGKEVGDYYDTNEMLIAIWCRLRDPDLGQADL